MEKTLEKSTHTHKITLHCKSTVKVKVAQSCPAVCDPMDCSLPGSSVHGILQARMLEWVAIPFSRESSQPRDRTQAFCIAGGFFTIWAILQLIERSLFSLSALTKYCYMKNTVLDSNNWGSLQAECISLSSDKLFQLALWLLWSCFCCPCSAWSTPTMPSGGR